MNVRDKEREKKKGERERWIERKYISEYLALIQIHCNTNQTSK